MAIINKNNNPLINSYYNRIIKYIVNVNNW